MFNAANSSPQSIIAMVQVSLLQIREAMAAAQNLKSWGAGVSLEDLTTPQPDGPGMTEDDAQAVLSACADAGGLADLYASGADNRDVPANYVYGASQQRVIGPRMR